jgi:DNA polymerase/3'-5' exonuclease PolX
VSQGTARARTEALPIAERLVARLRSACERVEIAGSLRREKPMVSDIEIVAVPRWDDRPDDDIWQTPRPVDLLEAAIDDLLTVGAIEARLVENHRADGTIDRQTKLGPAFKALVCEGMPVDLFIVRPPATWGCIFGLRTGPGDWNTRLVTDCQTIGRRVDGGQVLAWHSATGSWRVVPTPEERDFFAALGQAWVEPIDRAVERIRIDRTTAAGVPA